MKFINIPLFSKPNLINVAILTRPPSVPFKKINDIQLTYKSQNFEKCLELSQSKKEMSKYLLFFSF